MTRSIKVIYTEEGRKALGKHIEQVRNARQRPNTMLPELKENESYHCQYCQNDDVKPRHVEFDYMTIRDRHGKPIARKYIMDWRSDCCDEDFVVINTETNEEVPWPEVETSEVEGVH